MKYEIAKESWHTCKICGENIKNLSKNHNGGSGTYYTTVFKNHLIKDHNLSLNEYFTKFLNKPENECVVKYRGSAFFWTTGVKGYKWSDEAKKKRSGVGNPMYKKTPWNKNLDKNHKYIINCKNNRLGKKTSKETIEKQRLSAFARSIHGHSGKKHSEETKNILRQKTLDGIKNGRYKNIKTRPHTIFEEMLIKNFIRFESEKVISYWSFDIYLLDYNIYIEIDGDYWHSNPKIYPNGPKTKSQKCNYVRDISKNKFCIKNDLKLFRYWESDIINNIEKIEKELLCLLKKL